MKEGLFATNVKTGICQIQNRQASFFCLLFTVAQIFYWECHLHVAFGQMERIYFFILLLLNISSLHYVLRSLLFARTWCCSVMVVTKDTTWIATFHKSQRNPLVSVLCTLKDVIFCCVLTAQSVCQCAFVSLFLCWAVSRTVLAGTKNPARFQHSLRGVCPLCPHPIVPQSCFIPILVPFHPIVPLSYCVSVPLCPRPIVLYESPIVD